MASFDNAVMHSGGRNGGTTMLILCRDHQRSITVVKNVDGEHSADVFLLALEGLAMFHRNEI
jgi:serine beta-lactamase-like protein LACTB